MIFNMRIGALLLLLVTAACAERHPQLQVATPEIVQQGTEVSRTQVAEAATVVCPVNTTRREWVEYETRVQSGRGGSPSAIVRVQCIPNGMRPEEIPPLPRPATPLPVPHHAPAHHGHQIPYSGHQIPYRDTGHRPPGWYWGGGNQRPPGTYGHSCWTGWQWLPGPCLFR